MAKPALANDFNHACRYVALPRCAVNFFVILATIRASAWKLALPEISAYYFCSISIRTLAQAAIRLSRLRGPSSRNIMLWPNKNA
jgi:hypothetical protein